MLRQAEILVVLFEVEKALPDSEEVKNLIAAKHGAMAWYQLFDQQFAAAEQSALSGLEKDPNQEWINTNLALALLYQDKWEEAKQLYESHKDKAYGDGTYKKAFLEDLDALEKEGITHRNVDKARRLLQK